MWWHLSQCVLRVVSPIESHWHTRHILQTLLRLFSRGSSSLFTWETKILERIKEFGSDSAMVTQLACAGFLLNLFREINPMLKGGVPHSWFCNSITCWAVGSEIRDLQFCALVQCSPCYESALYLENIPCLDSVYSLVKGLLNAENWGVWCLELPLFTLKKFSLLFMGQKTSFNQKKLIFLNWTSIT